MDALTSRRIEGQGTPEAAWGPWLATGPFSALDWHELLPADVRLVVVAPHPDDEVLACGGLLSLHAARGGAIAIVSVTDGEASHPGDPAWTPPALAAARQVERRRGLVALGAGDCEIHRLRVPDGGVEARATDVASALASMLRPGDLVVTTWRRDGHPDHEATSQAAAAACAVTGAQLVEAPVWMWHWAQPGDVRVPWRRLRRIELPATAVRAKHAALAAHLTQLMPHGNGNPPVLGAAIRERAGRSAEYLFVN